MKKQSKPGFLNKIKTWLSDYNVTIGTIFICVFILCVMWILNKIL